VPLGATISLPWLVSWPAVGGAEAGFTLGDFDVVSRLFPLPPLAGVVDWVVSDCAEEEVLGEFCALAIVAPQSSAAQATEVRQGSLFMVYTPTIYDWCPGGYAQRRIMSAGRRRNGPWRA
jgi:hypothetical protein